MLQVAHQTHLAKRIKAQFVDENLNYSSSSSSAAAAASATGSHFPIRHMKQRARRMSLLMTSLSMQQQQQHQQQASDQSGGEGGVGGGGGESMLATVMDNTARGRAALHDAMGKSLVRCFLNVTSVLSCKDGMVCVAMSCSNRRARNAGKEVKNVYLRPQDLRLPESDKQWEESLAHILV
jgi:hypothetical protein